MEPAASIIARLGGARAVAAATGTAYTAPYRWQHPVSRGGTGGAIPAKHIPTLLALAKRKGVRLRAEEFFSEAMKEAV